MNKEEFEKYLIDIGGLSRTYKEHKGPITDAGWFCVGEGWYDMLKEIIDKLLLLGWNKRVSQVKEKFGGLRFYVPNEDMPEGGWDIIIDYEGKSRTICETCGEIGYLRKGGWIRTLCDNHSEGKERFDEDQQKRIFG